MGGAGGDMLLTELKARLSPAARLPYSCGPRAAPVP